jgi:hypothetical protein
MRLVAFPAFKVPPARTFLWKVVKKLSIMRANVMGSNEIPAFLGSLSLANDAPIGVFHFGGFLGLRKKYRPTAARIT